ncbi:MAG: hypothetical protein NXI31_17245 [bacterium]|nr:hypothetical protein [bacterium]
MLRNSLTLTSVTFFATSLCAQAVDWTQQTTGNAPSVRERTFTATDGTVYYTYGGQLGASTTSRDELWSWDGNVWTMLSSGTGPGTRCGGVMAYDDARGKLVLFSGKGTGGAWANYDNQTWEWDSTNGWLQMNPATVPDARWLMGDSSVYIPNLGVMFHGGRAWDGTGTGYDSDETWVWVGNDWVNLNTANAPAIWNHSMVYRPAPHNDVILFGGKLNGADSAATFRLDLGTFSWSQVTTAVSYPSQGTFGHLSYYNPITDRVIVHGGRGSQAISDTYEFDGVDWTDITVAGAPSCRNGGAQWVSALNVAVAGPMSENNGARDRTWHHGPNTWGTFVVKGTDCPTSAPQTATISSPDMPAIGNSLDIDFNDLTPGTLTFATLGFSDTVLGGNPLPIPIATFLPGSGAGCMVQSSNDSSIFLAAAGTSATLTLTFPNDPGLVGVRFFSQGIQIELGAPVTAANTKYAEITLGEF